MTNEDRVQVSIHIGFALATIEAFLQQPGVSAAQVRACLEGLEQAKEILSTRDDAPPQQRVMEPLKSHPNCKECQCYPECRNDCPDWRQCVERLPEYRERCGLPPLLPSEER